MSTQGSRLLTISSALFVGVMGCASGCAGVPPVPQTAHSGPPSAASAANRGHDEDGDGWLFNRLRGRSPRGAEPSASSQVVQTSASEPVASAAAVSAASAKEEEDSGFDISDLAPENVYKNLQKAAGYGPNEGVARALMKDGKSLFDEKKYAEAAAQFKRAAGRWPDSVLEEDALFMLGESYFFSDRYAKAQDTFGNLLKKYENSRHLDTTVKRLFAIGRYWEQLHEANPHWPVTPNLTDKKQPWFDTFGNALKAYETVRMNDPTGPMADDSIMATANAYFRKGRFEDAAFHYDMLRSEYSKSEHQAQAHLLGLQSKLRIYQGGQYDGTPLGEAEKIAEQTLTQFSGELGPERRHVAETREHIVEEKAVRDWAVAQYYDNKKQYGAARFYYQAIIKDYPLSKTAQKARARLGQIGGEPDNPPNRFWWLTNLFERDTARR